jgi:hypothetical protein
MTALAAEKMTDLESWTSRLFTLASGSKAYKGGRAAISLGTGKVVPASSLSGLFVIGRFAETVDATAADKPVNVRLDITIEVEWLANGTAGDAVAATDLGALCYALDDQTVSILPIGKALAGRVWGFDATRGVAVERLPTASPGQLGRLVKVAAPAYVANDCIIPANPVSGAIYDVPTTAAASTVTLPASAYEGTILHFAADGVKNGHTVQYRDAGGPTNLTTALLASKRHLVIATYLGGKWHANAYTAP